MRWSVDNRVVVITELNSRGRYNGWHLMVRYPRWGEQEQDRVETLFALHHIVFTMKQTPPALDLFATAIVLMRNTEMESPLDPLPGGSATFPWNVVYCSFLRHAETSTSPLGHPVYSLETGCSRARCWGVACNVLVSSVCFGRACPTVFLCSSPWGCAAASFVLICTQKYFTMVRV